jgi:hypothetical protein
MGWGLTIIGILLFITGLWGGQSYRGLVGTLMAAMAMAGVIISMAGLVLLFVPGFFG